MSHPTPTDSWLKKSEYDVDWVTAGGIDTKTDLWGNINYGPADGVNDSVCSDPSFYFNVINTSGVTKVSVGLWILKDDAFGQSSSYFFSQWADDDDRGTFAIGFTAGLTGAHGQLFFAKGINSNDYRQINTVNDYDDNVFHHVFVVWDESLADSLKLKIYVDGVLDNGTIRAGVNDSNWPSSFLARTHIFRRDNPSNFSEGEALRHKSWIGTALTAAQVLEEFNAELAARIPGDGGIIPNRLGERIHSRIIPSMYKG